MLCDIFVFLTLNYCSFIMHRKVLPPVSRAGYLTIFQERHTQNGRKWHTNSTK